MRDTKCRAQTLALGCSQAGGGVSTTRAWEQAEVYRRTRPREAHSAEPVRPAAASELSRAWHSNGDRRWYAAGKPYAVPHPQRATAPWLGATAPALWLRGNLIQRAAARRPTVATSVLRMRSCWAARWWPDSHWVRHSSRALILVTFRNLQNVGVLSAADASHPGQ